MRRAGPYQNQVAIAAVHDEAATPAALTKPTVAPHDSLAGWRRPRSLS